jgi:hypothetical protein
VSGALLGGITYQAFTWLTEIFPGVTVLVWWQRVGPGVAGIGIGYQPEGAIPKTGNEVRRRFKRPASLPPPGQPNGQRPATQPAPAPTAALQDRP